MNKIANLRGHERADLFRETAARMGFSPAIAEKDFWVCWVLNHLFADAVYGRRLVFKGGTSLSKVFGVIDRFSEDVDLILDWRLLGYGPGREDPFRDFDSATQQDRFNKQFNERAATYIRETFVPALGQVFCECSRVTTSVDPDDPQVVNVSYPAAFSEDYLRPEVRLEIGPLAAWVPSDRHTIRPYAAEVFPVVFDHPVCEVVAIGAERTFWEKATILHQQAHRTSPMPPRYARHYYDMYRMAESPIKQSAMTDTELLKAVVEFKQRFYPSSWARYDEAKPGTFRLIPPEPRMVEVRRDYLAMREMIFGGAPAFDRVRDVLGCLEEELNTTGD